MSVISFGGVIKTHVTGDITAHILTGSEPSIHDRELAEMIARSECHEASMLDHLWGIDDMTSDLIGSCDRSVTVRAG